MRRIPVPQRASVWLRVALLASVGLLAAGCADSNRFQSSSFDFNPGPPRPQGDVTGAVNPPPAQQHRVVSQPLPAPAQSNPVAADSRYQHENRSPPYVRTTHAAPQPSGHWTWDGGSAVMVGHGQTLQQIARKHGVPASAIIEVNHLRSASDIRPGQRLVIPRYVSTSAPHVAEHGKLTVAQNKVAPPKITKPDTIKSDATASVPTESVRVAKPEAKIDAPPAKTAEPAGAMPSFRWPVKGRIIAAFGAKSNGTQNDGINLAVPVGTPVHAADDGVVAYAGNELKGYGNLVLVRHANGYVSAYANASELLVKRGDTVKRGQVIAHAGQTGNVTSPQLHFEIRKGSVPVDPTKYLNGA